MQLDELIGILWLLFSPLQNLMLHIEVKYY